MPVHPLKLWLLEQGISQGELAARASTNQTYLSKILLGQRTPSREIAKRLSVATGRSVSIEKIVGYEIPKGAEAARKKPRGRSAIRGSLDPETPTALPEDPDKLH